MDWYAEGDPLNPRNQRCLFMALRLFSHSMYSISTGLSGLPIFTGWHTNVRSMEMPFSSSWMHLGTEDVSSQWLSVWLETKTCKNQSEWRCFAKKIAGSRLRPIQKIWKLIHLNLGTPKPETNGWSSSSVFKYFRTRRTKWVLPNLVNLPDMNIHKPISTAFETTPWPFFCSVR